MSKAFLALAGVALIAACGSDNNTTTPPPTQTQAQLATTLCQTLATNCPGGGADDQFENETESACEDSVKTVYNMSVSDASNDDLTCRVKEAQAAATDAANKAAHCRNAGPTGGSTSGTTATGSACGSLCDVYCDLQDRNCTSANPAFVTAGIAAPNFASHAACLTACQGEIGKGSATHFQTDGTVNDHGGAAGHHDTLQCRIWHLGKAQAGPSPHCFHTRLVSASDAAGTTTGAPCQDR